MKQKNVVTAIACLILFSAYNNSLAQTAPGLIAIKKQIEKTNAVYFDLFAKKDASIIALYTDDARLLSPNVAPISGKMALEKDFVDTFAAGQVKCVKFRTGDIYRDGKEYVTEEGTWQVFDPKGKLLDDGKYLKLWKRTKAGWKIFRDCFNSNHKAN